MRTHRPLAFLLIDVDRFKEVNTRFGHLGGDMVLAEIASLLKSSTRGSDAVVSYGGDQFLVILADTCQDDKFVEKNQGLPAGVEPRREPRRFRVKPKHRHGPMVGRQEPRRDLGPR